MNPPDDVPHDDVAPSARTRLDELSRLVPTRPSAALRARVAAALAEPLPPPVVPPSPSPSPVRWRWLAERLAWAGGGALVASLLAGLAGPPAAVAIAPTAVPAVPTERVAPVPSAAVDPAPEPVAEESLAWSDDGVHYLADGFPARIYRHWVVERRPDPSGGESLVPREDVFVVPASLR